MNASGGKAVMPFEQLRARFDYDKPAGLGCYLYPILGFRFENRWIFNEHFVRCASRLFDVFLHSR